jgi:hypothetical protein
VSKDLLLHGLIWVLSKFSFVSLVNIIHSSTFSEPAPCWGGPVKIIFDSIISTFYGHTHTHTHTHTNWHPLKELNEMSSMPKGAVTMTVVTGARSLRKNCPCLEEDGPVRQRIAWAEALNANTQPPMPRVVPQVQAIPGHSLSSSALGRLWQVEDEMTVRAGDQWLCVPSTSLWSQVSVYWLLTVNSGYEAAP